MANEAARSGERPELSWGHVNINVSDLERSIAFYRDLGFEVLIPGIPYLGLSADQGTSELSGEAARALGLSIGTNGRACIMQLGSGFPMIDLTELSSASRREPLGNADLGLVRLCLATVDLDRDYARLVELGVPFDSAPVPGTDDLARLAVCRDPDGTLIELIQIPLERWTPIIAKAKAKARA